MKKILISLACFTGILMAQTYNSGYAEVSQVKVWKTYIDVYLTADHTCTHSDKKRYIVAKDADQMYSGALSAMMANKTVNINYKCSINGFADVQGIRIKK